jgi:pyruvate dehydrogenase E2 component (dihydrolipoamide acetyltransferase)
MAIEIVMPRVDMDMTSGRMGRWHAAEGAHVEKGATLFEIETDKAAMEVHAPASGVLKFVAATEGDVLPVGACIGWIVTDGESFVPPPAKGDARGARQPVLTNGRSSERPMGAAFSLGNKGIAGGDAAPPLPRGEGRGEGAGYGRSPSARNAGRPTNGGGARLAA